MAEVLKVSKNSVPKKVAGAIASVLEKSKEVELHAIGAAAVNQAAKAIAIARGFVAPKGIDLVNIIAFMKVEINGEEKTGIKFIIKDR